MKKNQDSDNDSMQEIIKQYTEEEIQILKKPFEQEIISNSMNWLHLELKTRQNVDKLIKPIVDRSFEDRKAVLLNQQQNKLISDRLDKLEFYVFQERHISQEKNNQIRTLQDSLNELKNQEKELEMKRLQRLSESKTSTPVQRNSITSKGFSNQQRTSVRFAPDTKEMQSLQKLIKAEDIVAIKEEQNSITSNSSSSVQEEQNLADKFEMRSLNNKMQKLEDQLMNVHNKLEEEIKQHLNVLRKDKHHTKLDEYDYKLDIMKASQFSHQKEIDSKFEQVWMKVTNQDFIINNQNDKIDIISKQQIKIEEKFEDIQDFINKKVLLLSDEIQKFQVDTKTKLNENQKQIDGRTKDVENFNKTLNELFEINKQFTQNLENKQILIDKQRLNFEIFVPTVCLRKDFEQQTKEIIETIKILGQENMAQQFEINLMNNFVDKYLPLRLQHQISEQMRKTFLNCEYVQDLFVKYQLVDSNVFEQLHQILFLDNGKADMLETISKMNTNIVRAEKMNSQNQSNFQNKYKIITEQKIFDKGEQESHQEYDDNQLRTKQILEGNQEKRNTLNIDAQKSILQSLQVYKKISHQQIPQIKTDFLTNDFQNVKNQSKEIIIQKNLKEIESKKQNLLISKQQTIKKSLIEIKQTNNLEQQNSSANEIQKKKIVIQSVAPQQRDLNNQTNPNLEEIDENPESISFNQDELLSNDISLLNIQNNIGIIENNEQEERQKKAKIIQMASLQDNQQIKIRAIQTAINSRHENSQNSHDGSFISNQYSKKQMKIGSVNQSNGQIQNNKSQNIIQDQNVSFVQKTSNHKSAFEKNKNAIQEQNVQGELQNSNQQINILDSSKSDQNLQSIQEKLEDQILDDNALASNIEKLIYPNKKRDEKILLDQKFEEIHRLIFDMKITHEQSMSSQLQIFTDKMTEIQKIGVEKLKYEIKEQRVYVQTLQAQMENIEVQNKKKLQDFIEFKLKNRTFQNLESNLNPNNYETMTSMIKLNFESKLRNLKMVCETLISILQINLTGTDLDNSTILNTNDISQVFQNINQSNSFITHRARRPPTFNDEILFSQNSDRIGTANLFPKTARNHNQKYKAIIPCLFNQRNQIQKDLNQTALPSQYNNQKNILQKLNDSFQANKQQNAMRIFDGNDKNIYSKDSFQSSRTLFSSKQIQSSHQMQSQYRNINTHHQAFRNSAAVNQKKPQNDLRSSTSDWHTIKQSQPNFIKQQQVQFVNVQNNPLLIQENNDFKIDIGNLKKGINGLRMNLGDKQSQKQNMKIQNQQANLNSTINCLNETDQNLQTPYDINSKNEFNLLSAKSQFQKQDNKQNVSSQRRVLNLEAHIPREKIPEQLQLNQLQTTEYINKFDSPFKMRGPTSVSSAFDQNQIGDQNRSENVSGILNIYKKQENSQIQQKNQAKQTNDDLKMHSNTFTIILEENQNTDSTIQFENRSSAQNQSPNLKVANEDKTVNQSLNLSKLPFDHIQNQTMGSSPLSNLNDNDEEQQSITVDIYSKKQTALQLNQKKKIFINNFPEKESSKNQNIIELENQKKDLMDINRNLLIQCTYILNQIQINDQEKSPRDNILKKEDQIMNTNESTFKNSLGINSSNEENLKTSNMINIVVGKDSLPSLLGQSTPLQIQNVDRRNGNHNSVNYSGIDKLRQITQEQIKDFPKQESSFKFNRQQQYTQRIVNKNHF